MLAYSKLPLRALLLTIVALPISVHAKPLTFFDEFAAGRAEFDRASAVPARHQRF